MAKKHDDLDKLLEEVVRDVTDILAKSEEKDTKLAKASPGEEAPGEETPAGSSTEGSEPEASPAEETPGEAPQAPPSDQGLQEGSPDGAEQDPAMDEQSGPEALQAEYAKLPIEELKLHVMAAHAALMASMGDQGQPGQDQEAPPAQPGTPPEATPGTSPEATQQMGKSEKKELELRLATLEKSIKDKDDTIAQLEERFGKAVDGVRVFLEKRMNVGLRKSISGVGYDPKPGTSTEVDGFKPLAKSEAVKKLNTLTASSDLKKSDRDLITKYVIGNADQSTVAHLLK
jgi:hypothetical protein